MNTLETKDNFHKLIDRIDNDTVLTKFYNLLERAVSVKDGSLWNKLTEQKELLLIDTETDISENLISHSTMKSKHKKWLE